MQQHGKKKVLAAVEDLLFAVKINEAAKRAGMDVEFVKTEEALLQKAKEKPTLIVVDLNNSRVQPVESIAKLKSSADLKQISIIGFLSHVEVELKQRAQEAGANMVMARSAFSQNLPQIFKRHAGVL
jgi:PleD family two-component response regulator